MTLLAAETVSKRFNKQIILDDVSFTIQQGDRIGLVGKNGIGKTTLLELLAGRQGLDHGTITRAKNCAVDYVEQEKDDYAHMGLLEFVVDARRDLLDLRQQIVELEEQLERAPHDRHSLTKLGELQHDYEAADGFHLEQRCRTILTGLGFPESRFDDVIGRFSGGEKNRAGLARLLAGKGNLLLLDEPTNHLDIESTTWLEQYLTELNRACIIVSHDRAFLTATAQQVWEMAYGKLDVYVNGFERYLVERDERRRLAEHRHRHQQEEIRRIEDFVRRNIAGQKTRQAQSRQKYLNRLRRLPPPKAEASGPAITMTSSGRSFAHVLAVDSVSLGYGSEPVVSEVTFDMYRGDKVGLIGRNGSGKTTLLRALTGELEPIGGSVSIGNNVDVAYFDQDLSDLNETATVLDNIWELEPTAESGRMRSFLARFGFTGDDVFKVVSALSGGEKTKLSLARLLYHPANLIIMDEPTNHLDIYAREALEEALTEYDGTVLIVSHDRHFLDRVAQRIIYVDGGRAQVYDGNYSYFREKSAPAPEAPASREQPGKQAYLEFKELSRRRARHKKELQSAQSRIEDTERELERITADVEHNIPRHDWEALQAAAEKKKELENRLLELYVHLDELRSQTID